MKKKALYLFTNDIIAKYIQIMKKKIKKDCGVLFWITGLSGTGKSTIGEKIFRKIKKNMVLQL